MDARGKRSDAGSAGAKGTAVCPTHSPFRGFHTEIEINQNPAYLIYMQSASCKMPGWVKHKLESRFLREISASSDGDDTTLMVESEKELKSL